jgi:hypothetical protein
MCNHDARNGANNSSKKSSSQVRACFSTLADKMSAIRDPIPKHHLRKKGPTTYKMKSAQK